MSPTLWSHCYWSSKFAISYWEAGVANIIKPTPAAGEHPCSPVADSREVLDTKTTRVLAHSELGNAQFGNASV